MASESERITTEIVAIAAEATGLPKKTMRRMMKQLDEADLILMPQAWVEDIENRVRGIDSVMSVLKSVRPELFEDLPSVK